MAGDVSPVAMFYIEITGLQMFKPPTNISHPQILSFRYQLFCKLPNLGFLALRAPCCHQSIPQHRYYVNVTRCYLVFSPTHFKPSNHSGSVVFMRNLCRCRFWKVCFKKLLFGSPPVSHRLISDIHDSYAQEKASKKPDLNLLGKNA